MGQEVVTAKLLGDAEYHSQQQPRGKGQVKSPGAEWKQESQADPGIAPRGMAGWITASGREFR
jgi:hypothetical protein